MLQTLSCSCDDTRSRARTVHKHKTHTHTHTRTHVTLTHIDTSMSYVRGAKHTCLNTHKHSHRHTHNTNRYGQKYVTFERAKYTHTQMCNLYVTRMQTGTRHQQDTK